MSGNGEIIDVLSVVVAGESRKRGERRELVAAAIEISSLARLLARHKKEIASGSASIVLVRGSADTPTLRHSDVRGHALVLYSTVEPMMLATLPNSRIPNLWYAVCCNGASQNSECRDFMCYKYLLFVVKV